MSSFKIDKFLQKGDLPDFFRQLADALEKGEGGELSCAEDFRKLKITAIEEYGQVSLRAKIKSPSECKMMIWWILWMMKLWRKKKTPIDAPQAQVYGRSRSVWARVSK